MSNRDELADMVDGVSREAQLATADNILAAGYRKPRTITMREELDALDVRAVVRGKYLAEKWADPEGDMWHVAGKGMRWDTEQLIQHGMLPAVVLFELVD